MCFFNGQIPKKTFGVPTASRPTPAGGGSYGTTWYLMVPYGTLWYHMVPYGTIFELKTKKYHNSTPNCPFPMIFGPKWSKLRCDSFPEAK